MTSSILDYIYHHITWTSVISSKTKTNLFKTCVESILLYGSETWTMSKQLEKRLDSTYTRLLMRVQNINQKQHFTLEQIYGNLPKVSDVVSIRRNCFAGHCLHAKEEIISDLLFLSGEIEVKILEIVDCLQVSNQPSHLESAATTRISRS